MLPPCLIEVTMAKTAKPKPKSRRGRPKLESQQVLYQIKVSAWDMSWSLNLARPDFSRANEGHYSEHMILTLKEWWCTQNISSIQKPSVSSMLTRIYFKPPKLPEVSDP